MANTLNVNIVDQAVAINNSINIAIVNKPNPVFNETITGEQALLLLNFPRYWITDCDTGVQVTSDNIYDFFPELDPHHGGGGGGDVDTEISPTSTNAVQNKAIYNALTDKADVNEILTIPQGDRIITALNKIAGIDDNP